MSYQDNCDDDYTRAIDRSMTIDAIVSLDKRLDKRLVREYLSTLTLDALHDLEDSLLNCQSNNKE